MRIQLLSATLHPLPETGKGQSPDIARLLRPGQTIGATVTGSAGNTVDLEVSGRLLRATTTLALLKGERLTLKVESEAGKLVLRVTDPPERALAAKALRTALPRQAPQAALAERLVKLPKIPESRQLPQEVKAAIQQTLRSYPTVQNLTSAQGVRSAVTGSGLLMEAHLLAGRDTALRGDSKAALLRLVAVVMSQIRAGGATPPAPAPAGESRPELMPRQRQQAPQAQPAGAAGRFPPATQALLQALSRHAESALARIQVQQLQSLPAPERSEDPPWVIELPLLNGDEVNTLRLRIQREKRRTGIEEAAWSVRLDLDPPGFGPVCAVVSLIGHTVGTTFWSENETTTALFRDRLAELEERLREQGLEVGRLAAYNGPPPGGDNEPFAPDTSLLNERA